MEVLSARGVSPVQFWPRSPTVYVSAFPQYLCNAILGSISNSSLPCRLATMLSLATRGNSLFVPFTGQKTSLAGQPKGLSSLLKQNTACSPSRNAKALLNRMYCTKKLLKEGREVQPTGGVYNLDHSRDPMADRLRKARHVRGRRETGEFMIEERPFIMQALGAEVPLNAVFISERAHTAQQELEAQDPKSFASHPSLGSLPLAEFGQGKTPIYIVSDLFMSKLYPVDTPSMVALAPLLHSAHQDIASFKGMKRVLVLDNVLNPRNIGMILRNAEAFEVDGILLLTGPNATDLGNTQDILYSRLSISASRGAAFRVPFLHVRKDEFLAFAAEGQYDLICTSPHSDPDIPEWQPSSKKGAKKSTKTSKLKKKKKVTKEESDEEETTAVATPKYKGQIIVVGNESEGVRPEILQHATSLLTIPTAVESLNAAVACGIILFRLSSKDVAIRDGESKQFISRLPSDDDSL